MWGTVIYSILYCSHFPMQFQNQTWVHHPNTIPDSKVHEVNMRPTWALSAPDGPHVGSMNLAIRDHPFCILCHAQNSYEWVNLRMPHCFQYTYLFKHLDECINFSNDSYWQSDPWGLICIMLRSWWDFGDFNDIQRHVSISHRHLIVRSVRALKLSDWGSALAGHSKPLHIPDPIQRDRFIPITNEISTPKASQDLW